MDKKDKKLDLGAMISKHVAEQEAHYNQNKDKIEQERFNRANTNPTCLTYWYPKIQTIKEIKTPETYWYPVHFDDQLKTLDQTIPESVLKTVELIKEKGKILGYPLFIKNSLFSGKHDWKRTCFVEKEEDILNHFRALTDFHYMVGCEECLYWVVRKYLKPDALIFTESNMPVTFERRYFIEDGKVVFHHPYWPEKALLSQNPTPDNWKELLKITNHESDEEIKYLKELTEKVAVVCPGSWSIDWLKVGNDWYLIDMAEKHKSFMWSDYEHGKKGI